MVGLVGGFVSEKIKAMLALRLKIMELILGMHGRFLYGLKIFSRPLAMVNLPCSEDKESKEIEIMIVI